MIFKFDCYQIDSERYTLTRDGEPINVEPQVFDLLVLLIVNRDRIVSKDEILSHIWKGRTVSSGSIDSRIRSARLSIGDNGKDQKFIKTSTHNGYRFIAPTTLLQASDLDFEDVIIPRHRTRTTIVFLSTICFGLLVIFTITKIWPIQPDNEISEQAQSTQASRTLKKLVISPLQFKTNDQNKVALIEGFANDLTTELFAYDTIGIISNSSSKKLDELEWGTEDVLSTLDADYLLEGQAEFDKYLLRLTLQLSARNRDTTIWSESYEYDTRNSSTFEIRDLITAHIASDLSIALELSSSEDGGDSISESSKLVYVRAQTWLRRRDADSILFSIESYKNVIEADPDFVPAYAEIVAAHELAAFYTDMSRPEALAAMKFYLEKGQARAPSRAEILVAAGRVANFEGRWDNALFFYNKAIEKKPNYASAHVKRAETLHTLRRFELAASAYEKALNFDPLSVNLLSNVTQLNMDLGDVEAAETSAKLNVKWNGNSSDALSRLANIYYSRGQYVKAYQTLQKGMAINPDDYFVQYYLADWYFALGRPEDGLAISENMHIRAISLAKNGQIEESHKLTKDSPSEFLNSYAIHITGDSSYLFDHYQEIIVNQGYLSNDQTLGLKEPEEIAGMIDVISQKDPATAMALKSKLYAYFEHRPIGATSIREEFLGAITLACIDENFEVAFKHLDMAIENGHVFLDLSSFPIYSKWLSTPEFTNRQKRMVTLANSYLMQIEKGTE